MLKCLEEACSRFAVRIHGSCLIPNHFHLLIQQEEFRELLRRYEVEFDEQYLWD